MLRAVLSSPLCALCMYVYIIIAAGRAKGASWARSVGRIEGRGSALISLKVVLPALRGHRAMGRLGISRITMRWLRWEFMNVSKDSDMVQRPSPCLPSLPPGGAWSRTERGCRNGGS